MTVMDKVDGWNEEKLVGSRFSACMRNYTQAVCVMVEDQRKKI